MGHPLVGMKNLTETEKPHLKIEMWALGNRMASIELTELPNYQSSNPLLN